MHDSESVVDDSAKADIFNHYFHSVFTQEDLSSLDSLKHSLKYCPPIISSVKFLPSTVCSYLQSLDVSKACGPDLILIEKDISSGKVISCPHI